MNSLRLGVNIDHIATIRNARGGTHPDPVKAALIAEKYGADGITAHLREDRRHISDEDIFNLKSNINLPLNLEMAPTDEMFAIALKTLPNAVCLVPEKREEVTTEGGLNIEHHYSRLEQYIKEFKKANIRVSLFLEADLHMVDLASKLGADIIEFHTGRFCNQSKQDRVLELQKIQLACSHAFNLDIESHAGHGLNYETTREIIAIKELRELNIGHFIIGESIFDGFGEVIKKFKAIIAKEL
jgi:pyridoxine 5-phosphate synthase